MKKYLIILMLLSGCAVAPDAVKIQPPVQTSPIPKTYYVPAPKQGKIIVAVYGYNDLTGQREPTDGAASLSTAVTQGAENYLINSLKEFSDGKWFRVVERKGIDDVIKERQIIRSERENVDPTATDILPSMVYAGIIIEGGIVAYDSNVISGGTGARAFGIGASSKYSSHKVTIALRAVSVATSEVLSSVIVEKEVLIYSQDATVFKFFDTDTQTLELESGVNVNEAPSIAVKSAIEMGVYKLVLDGKEKHIW